MSAAEAYTYVDSTKIVGIAPTVHIPQSAYNRAEWLLDQFICERAPLDLLRGFARTIRVGNYALVIEIPSMYVYWRKCEAEDGKWYEPTGIYPTWVQADLYDEEGEKLPHDFDIHVIINKLTTHKNYVEFNFIQQANRQSAHTGISCAGAGREASELRQ